MLKQRVITALSLLLGLLLLLFAALNGSATRGAWLRWTHAHAP